MVDILAGGNLKTRLAGALAGAALELQTPRRPKRGKRAPTPVEEMGGAAKGDCGYRERRREIGQKALFDGGTG
jgi:hypothetical protein